MATTTNYSWNTPDNTAYVKDGASAIRTLGSSVDTTLYTALGGNYPGLRLVKKQTVGTGVSSVAVTAAFSTTFENYKIIYTGGVASTTTTISMILGATTAGYYNALMYARYNAVGVLTDNNNNGALWNYMGAGGTNGVYSELELYAPFLATRTRFQATHIQDVGQNATGRNGGVLDNNTSYTGFTLSTSAGTLTGGTIYVYGYGIS
jgi:hypothetical protein